MVPSIARQSVILKCNMQKSVLTGNYEYYYAAGLLANLYGIEIAEDVMPMALQTLLAEQRTKIAPRDEREKWLVRMAADYVPFEEYDEQMKELLLWGRGEPYLWQVVIPS